VEPQGSPPIFPNDVEARHSGISDCRLEIADWPKGRHRMVSLVETMLKLHNSGYSTENHIVDISNMVGLVETMMTADGLQPTALGPDEDEIGVVEGAASADG